MASKMISFKPLPLASQAMINEGRAYFRVKDILSGALVAWQRLSHLEKCNAIAEAKAKPELAPAEQQGTD